MVKLIVLDRDGVINHDSDAFIKSAREWRPIEGSLEAIALLNQAGWHVAIASNQSGIARGLLSMADLNAIHARMHRMLADVGARVDGVFFCPHGPHDDCGCRKPRPGLLVSIAERYGLETLAGLPVVGDSLRDLQAAAACQCAPHLVRTGKGRTTEAAGGLPPGTQVHDDLMACVRQLLAPPLLAIQAAG
jgi:D-glycero-D-manno-heptose 1,7-bisphosphate phosphatase